MTPIHFNRTPSDGRFNAPDGDYGVLYAAEGLGGAFAEAFLREPGRTQLPLDYVRKKGLAWIRINKELRLIKLFGNGLARLGATAEVEHCGLPYDLPQAWSKALRDHPSRPDGIAYRSRHDDDAICYAFYDHNRLALTQDRSFTDLEAEDWFWEHAERYGVGVAPS